MKKTSNHILDKVAQQILTTGTLPSELKEAGSLLVFLWALATVDWKLSIELFDKLFYRQSYDSPIWGGLLVHLIRLGPEAKVKDLKKRYLPALLKQHLHLSEKLDTQQEGLLCSQPLSNSIISPVMQTFWVWSNQAIIELEEGNSEDILSLILLNELSIFEINDRLWLSTSASYGQINAEAPQLSPAKELEGFLPLFAAIPDQERAEQMHLQLKALGLPVDKDPPLASPPAIAPDNAFMLYVGLLEYEMATAAQQLKAYYANNTLENNERLIYQAVNILWEKY